MSFVTDIRVERGISLEFCSKIWSCQGFVVTLQRLIEIVMTVIELNAQLLRELSYISDNEGYLQKTLDFIKKLTKSNVASNVRGQIVLPNT